MRKNYSFNSICAKDPKIPKWNQPHLMPIYASSTYEFETLDDSYEVFTGKKSGHIYSRYGNPNVDAVAQKIASLESYETELSAGAILTSSGMSAMSTLVTAMLETGDCILLGSDLYGGTFEFVNKLCAKWGIEVINQTLADLNKVEHLLKSHPQIKMLIFETPSNPLLNVYDLQGIASLARKYQCYTVVDNTFCTPYLQQPLKYDIDFVTHSTTKYLNGHGTGVTGVIVSADPDIITKKIWVQMKLLGTNTSPFEAWLINLGLKTLPLRMDRHCDNALKIAKVLMEHPAVLGVQYAGLESHKNHDLATKQMRNYGGFVSCHIKGGMAEAMTFLDNIDLFTIAPSFGDTSSLIMHPATSSHLNVPPDIREPLGITDNLIRLAIGLEDVDDLISDLYKSLNIIEKSGV